MLEISCKIYNILVKQSYALHFLKNSRQIFKISQDLTYKILVLEFLKTSYGILQDLIRNIFTRALVDNAKPFCVSTPRSIPFAYWDKLQAELDLLLAQGIIVPVTEPTE